MIDVPKTRRWFARLGIENRPTGPMRAPATPWTSSRTAPSTWPTCSSGWKCRAASASPRPTGRPLMPTVTSSNCTPSTCPSRSSSGTRTSSEPVPPGPPGRRHRGMGRGASARPMSLGRPVGRPSRSCGTRSCPPWPAGRSGRSPRPCRSWRSATARPRPSGSAPRSRRRRHGAASTWRYWTRSAGRRGAGPAGRGGSGAVGRRPWALPLQQGGVRRPGDGPLRCPCSSCAPSGSPGQAQAGAGRGRAGGPNRPAAARPPGRPAGRRQHGLGHRAGAGGHRPAASGRDPVVRAARSPAATWPAWLGWWPTRRPRWQIADEG